MMINFLNKKVALTAATFSVAAATLAAAQPAQAISFSTGGGPIDGSTLIDFESLPSGVFTPPASASIGDANLSVESGQVVITPGANQTASAGNLLSFSDGVLRIDFVQTQRFLGFDWLSANLTGDFPGFGDLFDTALGNTVQFLRSSNGVDTVVDTFTAADIGLTALSDTYVSFFAQDLDPTSSGFDGWNAVRFIDPDGGVKSFDIDNISYSNVPTPALLPGLLGMGAAALRKRRKAAEQESA